MFDGSVGTVVAAGIIIAGIALFLALFMIIGFFVGGAIVDLYDKFKKEDT